MSSRIEANLSVPNPKDEHSNLAPYLPIFDKEMEKIVKQVGDKRFTTLHAVTFFSKYGGLEWKGCPLEVRPSKYGRGVFATRDIKKGDIPTLYPCHLGMIPKGKDSLVEVSIDEKPLEYDPCYCLTDATGVVTQGDKDKQDPMWLGHLINDFCPFVEEFKDKNKDLGETIMKYFIYAISYSNCEFVRSKNLWCIRANKDIKAGEELLVAYTPTYWAGLNGENGKEMYDYVDRYCAKVGHSNPKKEQFLRDKFAEYHTMSQKVKA